MKAKGCHLERGTHKRTPFGVAKIRGLADSSVPAAADIEQFAPPVQDQTKYSACEGCSSSGAIYTTLAKAGTPLGWVPSQSGLYGLARAIDRHDPSIALRDEGTYTYAIEQAMGEFGVRPMGPAPAGTNCDLKDATINAEPLLSDLEQNAQTLLIGTYQINTTGAQKVQDVKLALAAGFAVRVDTEVDQAFEDWTPSKKPYGIPDYANTLGGHALYVVAYNGDVFTVRNSWGALWGMHGNLLASASFIAQADCYAWSVRKADS